MPIQHLPLDPRASPLRPHRCAAIASTRGRPFTAQAELLVLVLLLRRQGGCPEAEPEASEGEAVEDVHVAVLWVVALPGGKIQSPQFTTRFGLECAALPFRQELCVCLSTLLRWSLRQMSTTNPRSRIATHSN